LEENSNVFGSFDRPFIIIKRRRASLSIKCEMWRRIFSTFQKKKPRIIFPSTCRKGNSKIIGKRKSQSAKGEFRQLHLSKRSTLMVSYITRLTKLMVSIGLRGKVSNC
jgi:hypothetical protein